MPAAPKASENMTKNMTKAERAARAEAEAAVMPDRSHVNLKAPAYVRNDKTAAKYWRSILKRLEGISLMDDLDTEVLAVYCSMLSRRDATQAMYVSLLGEAEGDTEKATADLDAISGKLASLERSILQYAERLGLTPSGRIRLARKRAEAAANPDPDSDLFGD